MFCSKDFVQVPINNGHSGADLCILINNNIPTQLTAVVTKMHGKCICLVVTV